MAGQALAAKVRRLLVGTGNGVRIVAGAAPELVSALSFAEALGEVFGVAGYAQLRPRAGAYEHRERVREPVARAQHRFVVALLRHADFAGEVALFANAVPRGGSQLRRIYHRLAGGDMFASRAVASLAGHATLGKRRQGIGVLRACNPPDPARVALEASRQDGPRQIGVV